MEKDALNKVWLNAGRTSWENDLFKECMWQLITDSSLERKFHEAQTMTILVTLFFF